MERVGLVSRVEEELERAIGLGRLPESGQFGSEEKLARSYGVSRSTVREALRRLAARGLVVQHPGRKTRAVALDEALTLENLGVALHDERSPEGRRLLEGYFALKRQVTVELLADCCAQASKLDLGLLERACFALGDAARWEPGERCAQLEFELLKLAARVTERPGHLLLIQSLQRAFQGIAARVLPLVDPEALRQWACCAMNALGERDPEALRRELPALLRACDECVLGRLAPAPEGEVAPEAHRTQEERILGCFAPASEGEVAPDAHRTKDERVLGCLVQAPQEDEALEAHRTREEVLPVQPHSEAPVQPAALGFNSSPPGDESSGGELPGASVPNLSDCRTGSCAWPPEGGSQPEPPFAGCRSPTRVAVGREGGPLH